MGRSLDSFKDVMEEIKTTMTEFQDGLSCFRQLETEKQDVWLSADSLMTLLTVTGRECQRRRQETTEKGQDHLS
jgi:hypothetical protein